MPMLTTFSWSSLAVVRTLDVVLVTTYVVVSDGTCSHKYVIVYYLLLSLLKNVHCLIICMHLSVLSQNLVIFIMHGMSVMSCCLKSMFLTIWAFKMPFCFCGNGLSIK